MFLSPREKESRFKAVRLAMAQKGIDILIVRGSSAVRGDGAAFRFLTDFPNINIPLVLVFFKDKADPSVLLVESRFQAMRAEKNSWVSDIRLSTDFLQSLIEVLKEKATGRAVIGIDGLQNFPFLWGQKIEEVFPSVTLTEFGPVLKQLRATRSPEEIKLVKKSAALVDRAFTEGIKRIRPGNTEWQVMAWMDYLLKSNGVEKTFNIISQGPKVDAYVPSSRKIHKKGMVFTELTASYGGYWTQLARAVCLGKPDSKLTKLHQGAVLAIKAALPYLKPGYRVSQPMAAMEESVKSSGLGCTPVYGHIVGIDMV
ncbi:MAG TPA: M24 family metallopeptidase, partial [Terriglobales bacterium]|nr:M24 family metallopeptidase [Terriglobales bacterium]